MGEGCDVGPGVRVALDREVALRVGTAVGGEDCCAGEYGGATAEVSKAVRSSANAAMAAAVRSAFFQAEDALTRG